MKKLFLALILCFTWNVISQATVTSSSNQVIYNGDGATSTWSFPFKVYNSASENDLVVQELVVATGAITTLSLNTGYTVSLNNAIPSAGTITLTAGALPIGTNLSILRKLPLTQNVAESDNSPTPASVRNNLYDRLVMIDQQQQQQITTALLGSVFTTTQLSLPSPVANYGLCWDPTATFITNCTVTSGSVIPVPIPNNFISTLTTAGLVNGSSLTGSGTLTSLTTTSNSTGTLNSTGNVGIGTSSVPNEALGIFGGNVGIGSSIPGQVLDVQGTVRSTGLIVTNSTLNYGSSGSTGTALTTTLKIIYGEISITNNSSSSITNLPFTSTSTYSCTTSVNYSGGSAQAASLYKVSASQITIYNNINAVVLFDWICVGY